MLDRSEIKRYNKHMIKMIIHNLVMVLVLQTFSTDSSDPLFAPPSKADLGIKVVIVIRSVGIREIY